MHFTEFEIWQVVVPVQPGLGVQESARFDQTPIHLVQGRTESGLLALGEASRVDDVDTVERTLRQLLRRPLNEFTPATLWMEGREATGAFAGLVRRKPLRSWERQAGNSIFLLESLWLDAVGKAAGIPAHSLLGGAVRTHLEADYWASQPNSQELASLVETAVGLGCRGLKMKCDAKGNTVYALRDIANNLPGNFRFTIDPMFNWRSLHESRKFFRVLESLSCEIKIEDPFPFDAIDDWRQARQQHPLTLVWHTRSEDDLHVALREDVADVFNVACRSAGEAVYLSDILAFHGKDCWFGSQLETGVFQQVRLHSASVAPTCVLASDLQSQWVRTSTLVNPTMRIVGGFAEVPNTPGLGVDFDETSLRRYSTKSWRIK